MNIFNWHEDKTPEEVAKKFGIDDFVITKKSQNNIKKILSNKKKSPIWSEFFDITNIKIWMLAKINDKTKDKIWYIYSINEEEELFEVKYTDGKSSIIDVNSKNVMIDISWKKTNPYTTEGIPIDFFLWLTISNIKNENNWDLIISWYSFVIWMRIKYNNKYWKITKILSNNSWFQSHIINIEFIDGSTIEINDLDVCLENIQIYVDDLYGKKTIESKLLENDENWINVNVIDDLNRNTRVRKKQVWKAKRKANRYIANVDIQNKKITLISSKKKREIWFKEFYKKFELYRKDVNINKIEILEKMYKWTRNYKIQNLQKGMYLKENDNLYKIKEINANEIIIRNLSNKDKSKENSTIYLKKLPSIQENYLLLTNTEISKKINAFLGIEKSDLENKKLWEDISNIDINEIRIGQRVKNYKGKYWKLTNLWHKNIVIEFSDGSKKTYETFYQFKTEFVIWQQDLEKNHNIEFLDNQIRERKEDWEKLLNIYSLGKVGRVRKIISWNIIKGTIIDIKNNFITILFHNTKEVLVVEANKLSEENLEIYKKDIKNDPIQL